jgi:hypothetical protein
VTQPLTAEVPVPSSPVASPWHVGPWVDGLAYHASWVPPLLVLLALGPTFPGDYWVAYVLVLAMNFAHQALTVRFVYLDEGLRHADRRRLAVLPLAMLGCFAFELAVGKASLVRHALGVRDLLVVPAVVLLLVQLDAVLRDERPLRALRAWAVTVALGFGATGVGLARHADTGVPGSVLALGGITVLSGALSVASRGRRAPGDPVDRRTRAAELVVPALLVAATVAAASWPALAVGTFPARKTRIDSLLGPIAVVSYVWNFWHVYMQKYGILRLYASKAPIDAARRVPGWVDRLFVLAWLPLTFVVIGPSNAAFVAKHYKEFGSATRPFFAFLDAHGALLTAAGAAIVVASAGLLVAHERRATGLRSVPRLAAAGSFFLLSAALCFLDPIKVIIAFGFNHTLEYVVFVWAWQRRKQGVTDAVGSRRVARAVLGLSVALVAAWFAAYAAGKYVAVGWRQPELLGRTPKEIVLGVAIYLAITHFYVDGFLWKLRRPEVRAVLWAYARAAGGGLQARKARVTNRAEPSGRARAPRSQV